MSMGMPATSPHVLGEKRKIPIRKESASRMNMEKGVVALLED